MRGIGTLQSVANDLRNIYLPPLYRPPVKPAEPRTEQLVQWGTCVYVYSLIAHMERILAGLVHLAEAENVAASAPVCRHVFEWTALSCYLTGKLKGRFKQNDWEEAWELLTKVALGSRWMKEHGSKYAGHQSLKIPPEPVYIPAAVN